MRSSSVLRQRAAVAIVAALVSLPVFAASPNFTAMDPQGGARGTTVDVVFHGANLQDAVDVIFHDPGMALVELTAENDKKVNAKIEIAPDCGVGVHPIRIRTKSGLSNLQLFSVGSLTEIIETEPNNDPDAVAEIALNTTINGTIPSEDVDYFALPLEAGARLAVEVEAIRLGGPLFDAKVRLINPKGIDLKAEDDTPLMRQDAAFVFVAEEAGRHVLAVSEAAYGGGGGYRYRLHVGQFPRPLAASPLGGQVGSEVDITWLGDPGLASQVVALPADKPDRFAVTPALDTAVAPSQVPFRVIPYPGVKEAEPNNGADVPTAGAAPGAFDGVIAEKGDVDWFQFEGKKDQVYDIRVWARSMGSPLDSVFTILKPDGAGLTSNDDAIGPDSSARVTLPEDGVYKFAVQDHLGNGGPTYAYRVEVLPVEPKLSLTLIENVQGSVAVAQGNRAYLQLRADRADVGGALKTVFADLPAGVTADFDPIGDGVDQVPVVLAAAGDAPLAGALVNILTELEGNEAVKGHYNQDITLIEGQNRVVFLAEHVDRLALAVTEPAPFSIDIVQPKAPVVRNGQMNLRVVATRSEGFTAPIDLRIFWTPGGVSPGTGRIEENATESTILLDAKPNAAIGTHRLAVVGTSSGYATCTNLTPVTIADQWVTFEVPKVETEQGKPVEMVVVATQATPFEGTYKAELLGLPKDVTAPQVDITKDTTELRFPITVAETAPEGKFENIFVRTVLVAEGENVLHQSGGGQLVIYKPLPPEMQQPAPPPEAEKKEEEQAPERKTRFPTT